MWVVEKGAFANRNEFRDIRDFREFRESPVQNLQRSNLTEI
jgi:hypothetical protein